MYTFGIYAILWSLTKFKDRDVFLSVNRILTYHIH
jgi:hypothetical protein